MIAAVARPTVIKSIRLLNYLNRFELVVVPGAKSEVQKQLEAPTAAYTHIVVDLSVWGNIDDVIGLVERVKASLSAKIVIVAENHDREDVFIRDIVDLGIPPEQICYEAGAGFRRFLCDILVADGIITIQDIEPENHEADEPLEESAGTTVIPPSKITITEAKKRLPPKPAPEALSGATTIALVGAGHRIGTTTQAMQLLQYLRIAGYTAAIIEMHSGNSLLDYQQAFDDVTKVDDYHFIINDLDVYRGANQLLHCTKSYTYLVLDYGVFDEIPDVTSYLMQNIKVICCGAKRSETPYLRPIFQLDDGSLYYLFSFVPPADQEEVRQSMTESKDKTAFAPFAPSYWTYCGEDEFYSKIIRPNKPPKAERKKNWWHFGKK